MHGMSRDKPHASSQEAGENRDVRAVTHQGHASLAHIPAMVPMSPPLTAVSDIEYVGGPPETNRNARRDRKRKTRMVMDNAGVKRIIAALKLKRAKR